MFLEMMEQILFLVQLHLRVAVAVELKQPRQMQEVAVAVGQDIQDIPQGELELVGREMMVGMGMIQVIMGLAVAVGQVVMVLMGHPQLVGMVV